LVVVTNTNLIPFSKFGMAQLYNLLERFDEAFRYNSEI
jgi:hypothetical protein